MNNKKTLRNFWYNHYEYEMIATYDNFIGLVNIDIRKILYPHRRFFRSVLVKTRYIDVNDYDTLEDGCSQCFNDYVKELIRYDAKQKKLEKFFEKA